MLTESESSKAVVTERASTAQTEMEKQKEKESYMMVQEQETQGATNAHPQVETERWEERLMLTESKSWTAVVTEKAMTAQTEMMVQTQSETQLEVEEKET